MIPGSRPSSSSLAFRGGRSLPAVTPGADAASKRPPEVVDLVALRLLDLGLQPLDLGLQRARVESGVGRGQLLDPSLELSRPTGQLPASSARTESRSSAVARGGGRGGAGDVHERCGPARGWDSRPGPASNQASPSRKTRDPAHRRGQRPRASPGGGGGGRMGQGRLRGNRGGTENSVVSLMGSVLRDGTWRSRFASGPHRPGRGRGRPTSDAVAAGDGRHQRPFGTPGPYRSMCRCSAFFTARLSSPT